jgi:hypothetical protein
MHDWDRTMQHNNYKPKNTKNEIKLPDNYDHFRFLYKHAKWLAILYIMLEIGYPMTATQISQILDVHHETIDSCLHGLSEKQYISRPRVQGGWMLTKQGFQFIHPNSAEKPQNQLTTIIITDEESELIRVNNNNNSAEFPQNDDDSAEIPLNQDKNSDIFLAFREVGIIKNALSEKIANIPGLTGDIVRKEWHKLNDQGKPWQGLLLRILEEYKPPPTDDQKRARYREWDQ